MLQEFFRSLLSPALHPNHRRTPVPAAGPRADVLN